MFFLRDAQARKKKNYCRQATYMEKLFPMIRDTSAALELQASNSDKPYVATRSAQDDYVENGPQGTKSRERKRVKLRERPPVPYVPVKDKVKDEVVRM